MKILFLEAPYDGTVELCRETLTYLREKGYKTLALFSSVQFRTKLALVEKQLEEMNIKVTSFKLDRAFQKGQLLGCNLYSLPKTDCYLYVGDGNFHPLTLIYGQKDNKGLKEVICNDPISGKMSILTINDVKNIFNRYKGALLRFLSSKNIGVLISTKPGQQQFKASLELEEKYKDKKFYYFIDNNISFDQLENFPFVEVWVNTACPRIAFDEQKMFAKGIVNLNDMLGAKEMLS